MNTSNTSCIYQEVDLLLRAEDGSELSLSWEAQTLDWQLCLFRLFNYLGSFRFADDCEHKWDGNRFKISWP